VPEEEIKAIESVLTIMDGKIVHGTEEFGNLAPPLPPVSPDWSPAGISMGARDRTHRVHSNTLHSSACSCGNPLHQHTHTVVGKQGTWGIGCTCFAF